MQEKRDEMQDFCLQKENLRETTVNGHNFFTNFRLQKPVFPFQLQAFLSETFTVYSQKIKTSDIFEKAPFRVNRWRKEAEISRQADEFDLIGVYLTRGSI